MESAPSPLQLLLLLSSLAAVCSALELAPTTENPAVAADSLPINFIEEVGSCSYEVSVSTSCSSSPFITAEIGVLFGDSHGNQVIEKKLSNGEKVFGSCNTDSFVLKDRPCNVQISYMYIYKDGADDWLPTSVEIYGSGINPVLFIFKSSIPKNVWFGFDFGQYSSPPPSSDPTPPPSHSSSPLPEPILPPPPPPPPHPSPPPPEPILPPPPPSHPSPPPPEPISPPPPPSHPSPPPPEPISPPPPPSHPSPPPPKPISPPPPPPSHPSPPPPDPILPPPPPPPPKPVLPPPPLEPTLPPPPPPEPILPPPLPPPPKPVLPPPPPPTPPSSSCKISGQIWVMVSTIVVLVPIAFM